MTETKDASNDVDLEMLVNAIRLSSRDELSVLSNIAASIEEIKRHLSQPSDSGSTVVIHKEVNNKKQGSSPKKNASPSTGRQSNSVRSGGRNKRAGERELGASKSVANAGKEGSSNDTAVSSVTSNRQAVASDVSSNKKTSGSNAQSADKSAAAEVVGSVSVEPIELPKVEVDFSSFWKDEKGRLRKQNGQYASKDERKQYEQQSAKGVAQEREENKKTGVLAKVLERSGKLVKAVEPDAEQNAAEASFAAVGGIYFYAAKELFDMARNTKEKWDDVFGSEEDENSGDEKDKSGLAKRIQKWFSRDKSKAAKAEVVNGHADKNNTSSKHGLKDGRKAEQRIEVLKEQSAQQEKDSAKTHDKLDEIVAAIKSGNQEIATSIAEITSAGGEGGGIDLDFDRKKRSRSSRKGGRFRTKKPRGKLTSILSKATEPVTNAGRNAANMVKGGAGKVGGFFGKAGSVISGGFNMAKDTLGKLTPGSFLKGAGPAAAVLGGLGAYNSLKDRDDLSGSQKAAQVGGTVVGAGAGAMGGASLGAAIGGLLLPGIGAIPGGIIGSLIGGNLGEDIGADIGAKFSDFLGSDQSLVDYMSNAWGVASSGAEEMLDTASVALSAVGGVAGMAGETIASWFGGDDEEATPAKGTNSKGETESQPVLKYDTNQSISEMLNTQALRQSSQTSNSDVMTVSLDDKSLSALKNSKESVIATSNPNVTVKTAESRAPVTIPSDFSTRELRRQAADLD